MTSLTLVLTRAQWEKLSSRIIEEYGVTILMLRQKCKRVVGFTKRDHEKWTTHRTGWSLDPSVRLDFYDENMLLLFLIKYSEYIEL